MSRPAGAGLVERVRARIAATAEAPTPARVAAALRAEDGVLSDLGVLQAAGEIGRELTGAGVLEPLLHAPGVTDVLVNAPDEVWLDRGHGLERAEVTFPDARAVRRLAQRLAASAGRRLDAACPYVDAVLADGSRLHAVLAPVASGGTVLSLRVPSRTRFTLAELVAAGSLPPAGARCLEALVAARLAFLVCGGTGSGKSTVLTTLLGLCPAHERLVLVEDARELDPAHPHVVRLASRPPNVEGAGTVTLADLVRQAMRMRPDRLVVGEARGAEVVDLLAALNTGHEGGAGTVHANAAADVPARLEALAAPAGMPRAAVHSQLAAGLQAVLHLRRGGDGRRRVTGIGVLRRGADDLVTVVDALVFGRAGVHAGPAVADLAGMLRCRGIALPAGVPDGGG